LFFIDEIDFASTHDVSGAQTNIDDGKYPVGSKSYIWHTYSIADYNYVAIPGNAANKAAAAVLSNLILRPDRQALQKIPAQGFGLGYGVNYNSLSTESQVTLDLGDQLIGDAGVPSDELARYLVGDLTIDYHIAIVNDWFLYVGANATAWVQQ
jgi:putative spermidine/putrescine transport system substrate-binding protein